MTAASLTSPMPMPAGIGERGDEQEAARGGAGDQVLGERAGVASAATSATRHHGADAASACWG